MDFENMSFEQCMARLEEITRLLEKGDVPLEQSLKFFEEGIVYIYAPFDTKKILKTITFVSNKIENELNNEELKSFVDTFAEYQNKHNITALKRLYSADFVLYGAGVRGYILCCADGQNSCRHFLRLQCTAVRQSRQ